VCVYRSDLFCKCCYLLLLADNGSHKEIVRRSPCSCFYSRCSILYFQVCNFSPHLSLVPFSDLQYSTEDYDHSVFATLLEDLTTHDIDVTKKLAILHLILIEMSFYSDRSVDRMITRVWPSLLSSSASICGSSPCTQVRAACYTSSSHLRLLCRPVCQIIVWHIACMCTFGHVV
jgi:hypothetical protein